MHRRKLNFRGDVRLVVVIKSKSLLIGSYWYKIYKQERQKFSCVDDQQRLMFVKSRNDTPGTCVIYLNKNNLSEKQNTAYFFDKLFH